MNEKIEIFLHFYQPTEVSPGYWEGNFMANRKQTSLLYKMRDELTDADWWDIAQGASAGHEFLPNNLKLSLKTKFDDFEEFFIENNLEGKTITEILNSGVKYKVAQQKVWGVLSSCIECIYFREQQNKKSDSPFEYA